MESFSALPDASDNPVTVIPAAAGATQRSEAPRTKVYAAAAADKLKTGGYFALWFSLTMVYSFCSGVAEHILPTLPLTVLAIEFGVGVVVYLGPQWAARLRKRPKLRTMGSSLGPLRYVVYCKCKTITEGAIEIMISPPCIARPGLEVRVLRRT